MQLIKRKVAVKRDVEATAVPSGEAVLLRAGATVEISQSLGGNYIVKTLEGQTLRLAGKDGDAIGEKVVAEAMPAPAEAAKTADEKQVLEVLKTVYDPEIPVNVVDLGLIYECRLAPSAAGGGQQKATIKMTLTAPGCGMGEVLKRDVETRVKALPGIAETDVQLVFDPPWDKSRMSDVARLVLGMF